MTGWLLDTNVVSELRKKKRANANVLAWAMDIPDMESWLSVLVLGEIRCGIERIRPRDKSSARHLDRWADQVERVYEGRILPVDQTIAVEWGRLHAAHGLSAIDGLLAATAIVHELTLVTRNTKDIARTGAAWINPFMESAATPR